MLKAAQSFTEKHGEEIAYISGPSSLLQQDLICQIRSAAHNTERGGEKKHTFKHQKPTCTFTLHTHPHKNIHSHTLSPPEQPHTNTRNQQTLK